MWFYDLLDTFELDLFGDHFWKAFGATAGFFFLAGWFVAALLYN